MKNNIRVINYTYNEQESRPNMRPHRHRAMELNYIVSGEADIFYNDPKTGSEEKIKLFPNNFVLINPYITHYINSDLHVRYYMLEITVSNLKSDIATFLKSSAYVQNFDAAVKLLNSWSDILLFKDTQNMPHLLRKFRKLFEYETHNSFYEAELEICLKQLFLAIIRCANEPKSANGQNIHIKRAMSFMQANYDKNITAKDIANNAKLSITHLHRVFKDALDTTVMDTLNNIRIKKAAQFLLDSSHTVNSIAKMTGYKSIQAFKYNFKKIFNKSPTAYKQEELSKIVRFQNLN